MHNQFVLIIKEHRVLGALLQPYLIEVMEGRSFFRVTDMLTPGKVKELNFQFTESNMNMIDTAFQFSDEVLLRKFSKKKVSASDFIEKMDPDYFKKVVRPYIDKKIATNPNA
jgi:hypothetical protein